MSWLLHWAPKREFTHHLSQTAFIKYGFYISFNITLDCVFSQPSQDHASCVGGVSHFFFGVRVFADQETQRWCSLRPSHVSYVPDVHFFPFFQKSFQHNVSSLQQQAHAKSTAPIDRIKLRWHAPKPPLCASAHERALEIHEISESVSKTKTWYGELMRNSYCCHSECRGKTVSKCLIDVFFSPHSSAQQHLGGGREHPSAIQPVPGPKPHSGLHCQRRQTGPHGEFHTYIQRTRGLEWSL